MRGRGEYTGAAGRDVRARLFTAILAVVLWTGSVNAGQPGPRTLSLEDGALRGADDGSVSAFLGIPYAAPPVGALRWKAPQRPSAWEGTRDATDFGPPCPQGGPLAGASSEDCLSLNVWTPDPKPGARLPVMVWIHGGGFNFGSASQAEYDGRALASLGVVVVTLNYRLGPLGFLVHPGPPGKARAAATGNYGLLDQIAALNWVRRNIAAFGGDPGLVTAFGQSAGSRSVSLLTLSPLASGLFQRAISQSGGPIVGSEYLSPAFNGDMFQAAAMGKELGGRLGCAQADDPLACMRGADARDVITAADCRTGLFDEGLFFAPVFDARVLPADPVAALESGRRNAVPQIMGGTANEGAAYLRGETGLDTAKYRAFLAVRFGPRARQALGVFPPDGPGGVPGAIDSVITVAANAQPARLMARAIAQGRGNPGAKAYLYHFSRRPGTPMAKAFGAFHGVDLAYVFGNMDPAQGYTDTDAALSRLMMAYWVNFARTGDPNGPGLPPWPAYDPGADVWLEFSDTVATRQGLLGPQCDFADSVSRFGALR